MTTHPESSSAEDQATTLDTKAQTLTKTIEDQERPPMTAPLTILEEGWQEEPLDMTNLAGKRSIKSLTPTALVPYSPTDKLFTPTPVPYSPTRPNLHTPSESCTSLANHCGSSKRSSPILSNISPLTSSPTARHLDFNSPLPTPPVSPNRLQKQLDAYMKKM